MLKTKSERTRMLQSQFICPIWVVWFGQSCNLYFSRYHARQFMRALRLKRTPYDAYDGRGENFGEADAWASRIGGSHATHA